MGITLLIFPRLVAPMSVADLLMIGTSSCLQRDVEGVRQVSGDYQRLSGVRQGEIQGTRKPFPWEVVSATVKTLLYSGFGQECTNLVKSKNKSKITQLLCPTLMLGT